MFYSIKTSFFPLSQRFMFCHGTTNICFRSPSSNFFRMICIALLKGCWKTYRIFPQLCYRIKRRQHNLSDITSTNMGQHLNKYLGFATPKCQYPIEPRKRITYFWQNIFLKVFPLEDKGIWPTSFQCSVRTGQGKMVINWSIRISTPICKRTSQWGWLSTGMGCPERLWSLLL